MRSALRSFRPRTTLRLAILAGLAVGVVLSACGDLSPEGHVARAREYLGKGQTQAAVIELKSALQKAPELAEARKELGLLYIRAGDGASGEKELRQAIRLGVPEASLLVPLTRAAILQEQYQVVVDQVVREAAESASGSPAVHPSGSPADSLPTAVTPTANSAATPSASPSAHSTASPSGRSPEEQADLLALRGHAYVGLRKLDLAKEFYAQSQAIQPENGEAGLGNARIAGLSGDLKGMREALEKTVNANPTLSPAWSFLGDLERYEGNLEAAEKAYGEAIGHGFFRANDYLNRALVRIARDDLSGAEKDVAVLEKRLPRSAAGSYARGLLALKKKDTETAERSFQEALVRSPDYLPAVYYAGLASALRGRYEQAEHQLVRFLGAQPASDHAAKLLAAVRGQRKDFKGVEEVLKPVLARNPGDATALRLLGDAALARGKADQAVDYFQKVVAQEGESSQAHLKLGLGMLAAGREAEGLKAIEEAARLDPEGQRPDLILFNSHLRAKRYAEALEVATRLGKEKPDDPVPPILIGTVKLAQGDEAGARQAFEESLRVKPGFPQAAQNLALLDLRAGQLDAAKSRFENALRYEPKNQRLLLGLAGLQERVGDAKAAVRTLESLVESHPQAVEPRVLLARHYTRMGQPEKALGLLKVVEQKAGDDPVFLAQKGLTLLEADQNELATESFGRLVRAVPRSAEARYLLARTLLQGGDANGARAHLAEALKLDPRHSFANITLAKLLIREGKLDEADAHIRTLQGPQSPQSSQAPQSLQSPQSPQSSQPPQSLEPAVAAELRSVEAEIALQRGDPDRAVAAFQEAFSAYPGTQLALSLAKAQVARKDTAAARATLEAWTQEHPADARAVFGLGQVYELDGYSDKALAAYERVIALSPDFALALNNAAWLLRDRDPGRAAAYTEKALRSAPDNPAVLDTAGVVNLKLGKTERAAELLERAVEAAPQSGVLRFHLVQALAAQGQRERAATILTELLDSKVDLGEPEQAKALAVELGISPR